MSTDRSAGRWCAKCEQHGSHHTDRHDDFAERDVNRRYNVNMGNPAPGFLDRAERALDDMGPFGDCAHEWRLFGSRWECVWCDISSDSDPEQFCPRCLAGTESPEHFEKCGGAR